MNWVALASVITSGGIAIATLWIGHLKTRDEQRSRALERAAANSAAAAETLTNLHNLVLMCVPVPMPTNERVAQVEDGFRRLQPRLLALAISHLSGEVRKAAQEAHDALGPLCAETMVAMQHWIDHGPNSPGALGVWDLVPAKQSFLLKQYGELAASLRRNAESLERGR